VRAKSFNQMQTFMLEKGTLFARFEYINLQSTIHGMSKVISTLRINHSLVE